MLLAVVAVVVILEAAVEQVAATSRALLDGLATPTTAGRKG